jgi:sterol 24-C-methyltransferase
MREAQLEAALADPATRRARHVEVVQAYYQLVTPSYRATWGDSFHFGIFADASQSRVEAIRHTELALAREAGFAPGMAILDIGSGIGGPALNIAASTGVHVTGIDLVAEHVAIAIERAARVGLASRTEFRCADAARMPFPNERFDGAYIFESGCYLPDKARFYQEILRVLRPGGVFVGIDWMRGSDEPTAGSIVEIICRSHAIPDLISLPEAGRLLRAAGLVIERLDEISKGGQIERNWAALVVDREGPRNSTSCALAARLLEHGGEAIGLGARTGAFVLGHWLGRKAESA